jgi:hypothetical protein
MFFIKKDRPLDDPRREFLVNALSAGAFIACGSYGLLAPTAQAAIFGKVPRQVPEGKSFFTLEGDVKVNGQKATEETLIQPNDTVQTGEKSQAIFVVGKDAFILRSNSELKLTGTGILLTNMRLLTGKLLSVFGKRGPNETRLSMVSRTATIGIRGTRSDLPLHLLRGHQHDLDRGPEQPGNDRLQAPRRAALHRERRRQGRAHPASPGDQP